MNGNTTWGTAQPNGKVKVDQWLDGSSAPAFASAGVLTGANVVPVANSLQADVGGVAGTDDFVYAKNTQSDGVVLGNHVATPTRLTFTAPGTSGQSQVFTVLVWKSASIVGTSQNGVEEVSKPIFVAGTPAATGSQTAPTDSQIRSALGATPNDFIGAIADITIANGQTILLMSNIVRRQSTIPWQNVSLATFKNYSTLLPHATNDNVALGYGSYGTLHRYGDLVFMSHNGGGKFNANPGETPLGEAIPYGYRPTMNIRINLSRGNGGTGQTVVYTIFPNGSMRLYTSFALSNEFLMGGYASWITSDAWPS